jgi:CRP-like cAMP-binding protein
MEQCQEISLVLNGYASRRLVQTMRIAACHVQHPLERRLASWIATATELVGNTEVSVTHSQLAVFLGVARQSVTLALQDLEGRQAIRSKRSKVQVRNQSLLATISCGCYRPERASPTPLIRRSDSQSHVL